MKPATRIQYNSPVVLTYALLSLAALGLSAITDGASNRLLFSVYRAPLTDPLMYVRLFTSAIGHANWQHFFGNFSLILLIGPLLEEKYGGKELVIMMAVASLAGSLFFIATAPHGRALGASGVVFALVVLTSCTNFEKGRIPLTFILIMILWVGREVVIMAQGGIGNINHMAHIIGGLCGAAFGMLSYKEKAE